MEKGTVSIAGLSENGTHVTAPPLMTLRDWFAGQTLRECIRMAEGEARSAFIFKGEDVNTEHLREAAARLAYAMADAMLVARESGQ